MELSGIGSTNGVTDHLKALERKGYIQRERLVSRGLRVLHRLPRASKENVAP
jgi:repressor LexA